MITFRFRICLCVPLFLLHPAWMRFMSSSDFNAILVVTIFSRILHAFLTS